MEKKNSISYIPIFESIGSICPNFPNDVVTERSIRIKDKYFKALFLYYNGPNDCKNIILSYLMWKIKIGDLIDVKDCIDDWYISVVLKCRPGLVFIHYVGWGKKWDEWVSISHMALAGNKTNGDFYGSGSNTTETDYRKEILSKEHKNTKIYIHHNERITSGEIDNITCSTNVEEIYKITYYDFNYRRIKEASAYVINSYIDQHDLQFMFITI